MAALPRPLASTPARLTGGALFCAALLLPVLAHGDVTRTLTCPAGGTTSERIEIPADRVVKGAEVLSLTCAEDGAQATAVSVKPGYQGFERGHHFAWLVLPEHRGLPAGHEGHALRLTVRLD